jgi:asparaginyl-tRNA synthetase
MDKMSGRFFFFRRLLGRRRKSKPQTERSELALLETTNFVLENNFKRVSYVLKQLIFKRMYNKKRKNQLYYQRMGC